jgi:CRP-like cAMP-binding protein
VTHSQNLLLASLSSEDLALIQPHLKKARVEQHQVLFDAGSEVHSSYFPLTAIVSLVMGLQDGETVETAMVGCDGVVSASAALDGKISLSKGVIQLAGDVMVCEARDLKAVAMQSGTLLSVLIRHEQTLFAQAQQSAACLANHNIEARLCRWLLRARDLARSDTLSFTQEYLAEMLGASRPSVTTVAHTLQRAGMIQYARGKIQILDAEAVQDAACECYEAVKMHYQLLLGHNQRPSS